MAMFGQGLMILIPGIVTGCSLIQTT